MNCNLPKLEQFFKATLIRKVKSKAGDQKYGLMVVNMRVNGLKIKPVDKESSGMQMEIDMKANGKETKQMDMVFTCTMMEQDTLVIGRMIFSTVTARKHGLMVHSFKATMLKGRNKVKVLILGRMVQPTLEDGKIIKLMDMECTHGLMEENLKAVGKIIICTEEVYIVGLMDVYLKVNT